MTKTEQYVCDFQRELIKLTEKYNCCLYAEDEFGREILDICAYSEGIFDMQLFTEDGKKRQLFKKCKDK